MTTKLPPGVSLNGVKEGGKIADSDWVTDDSTSPLLDNGYATPKTVSDQLKEDADLE